MPTESIAVRAAVETDLPRLHAIYNHYVENSHATFDVAPAPLESRREWLDGFSDEGPHRLLVAESQGEVVGYTSSGPFHPKGVYARSVEASIYLTPEARGRGWGTRLYERLFEVLDADSRVHRIYAGITLPNDASVSLHLRMGFRHVGTFEESAFKSDAYWDLAWYGRDA